ncbi:hypothetical protein PVAP13_9KG236700 [Panicum virgatum]|uniref:Uncharacterized protein n=1 Tax=Panicum virgatum TaxID=38727 RepID=A0A8T0NJM0_PANVG|nr:hypothetical protein PVAP13_9KG236700 [Panicum virgatum]
MLFRRFSNNIWSCLDSSLLLMKRKKMTYEFKFPRMHIFAECDKDSDPEPDDYDTVKALPSEKIEKMVEDLRVALKLKIYKLD